MSKIVAVNLVTKSGTYRLGSVVSGKDGSYYAIYPNNSWSEKTGIPQVSPIKYSYHASGKSSRFTVGKDGARVAEFKRENRTPVKTIQDSTGMSFFSLFDIHDNIEKMLDPVEGKRGYKNVIEVNAEQYQHLTIRFFLAEKGFELDKPRRDYAEVHRFECEDVDVVVTIEDKWEGKDQKKLVT